MHVRGGHAHIVNCSARRLIVKGRCAFATLGDGTHAVATCLSRWIHDFAIRWYKLRSDHTSPPLNTKLYWINKRGLGFEGDAPEDLFGEHGRRLKCPRCPGQETKIMNMKGPDGRLRATYHCPVCQCMKEAGGRHSGGHKDHGKLGCGAGSNELKRKDLDSTGELVPRAKARARAAGDIVQSTCLQGVAVHLADSIPAAVAATLERIATAWGAEIHAHLTPSTTHWLFFHRDDFAATPAATSPGATKTTVQEFLAMLPPLSGQVSGRGKVL